MTSDSDDDFCSSCSGQSETEVLPLQQAWAAKITKRFAHKKKFGRKPYRKGFQRKKSTWVLDAKRNLSSEVPEGWDKQKWLSRTPCVGCGSRWHRTCEGKGKSFPLFKKKHKGSSKGGSAPSASKGSFKGSNGKTAFGTFWCTAATMLATAQSLVLNSTAPALLQDCFNCTPIANVFNLVKTAVCHNYADIAPVFYNTDVDAVCFDAVETVFNSGIVFEDECSHAVEPVRCLNPWLASCVAKAAKQSYEHHSGLSEDGNCFCSSETLMILQCSEYHSSNVVRINHLQNVFTVNSTEFDLDPDGYFVGFVPKCDSHRGFPLSNPENTY